MASECLLPTVILDIICGYASMHCPITCSLVSKQWYKRAAEMGLEVLRAYRESSIDMGIHTRDTIAHIISSDINSMFCDHAYTKLTSYRSSLAHGIISVELWNDQPFSTPLRDVFITVCTGRQTRIYVINDRSSPSRLIPADVHCLVRQPVVTGIVRAITDITIKKILGGDAFIDYTV